MSTKKHDEAWDNFFCEACQNQLMGAQVRLDDGTRLPVCGLCWNQIPVGQKVKLVSEWKHHAAIRQGIDAAAGWLDVFHRVLDMFERKQQEVENSEDATANSWADEIGGEGPGLFSIN